MQALSQLSYGPTRRGGTVPDPMKFVKKMNRLGLGGPPTPPWSVLRRGRGRHGEQKLGRDGDDHHQQAEYGQATPVFQSEHNGIIMHVAARSEQPDPAYPVQQ